MKAYESVRSVEDMYKLKAEARKKRAAEPFEKKLQALVRMQYMQYEMNQAAGRSVRKPWHWDKVARIDKKT